MKKRIAKKLKGISLAAVLAMGMVGCGDDAKDASTTTDKTETTEQTDTANDQAATEQQDSGETGEASLVGTWKYGDTYAYTFEEGGKGNYDAGGNVMNFTYVDNGDSVTITYDGNTQGSDFKYHIDGDTLVIEDSFGEEVRYTKS